MVIIKAAMMFKNGEVVEGYNYSLIATMAHKLSLNGEHLNGFITSRGEFVPPSEAAGIALTAGQISDSLKELSPEDLWPEYLD
jgi:hypothetical protein